MSSIRINKYLAERLGLSRRECDDYITGGRVEVDGEPARLGQSVNDTSQIKVDGQLIDSQVDYKYILLHKPAGYVCSRRRQGDSPTVYELLPDELHELKLVGRLDRDSSGLILLTNDGDFAHQMTHPKFHKVKLYEVTLDQALQPLHRQMISEYGVMLEDGKSQFGLSRLREGDESAWQATLTEGRNRQIRRSFAALGYTVTSLHRTTFGPYALDELQKGDYVNASSP